jgi:hypothetical protein
MSFLYRFTSFRVPLFVVTCDLHDLTHSHAKPTTINSHVALFLLSSSKPLQQPFSIRSHSRTYQPTSTYQPTLHHGESERERERERAPNNKRDTQITRSPLTTTMNNANTAASANAEEAALYDAVEAELRWATETALREQVRRLRVEVREAEARSMPAMPRPACARLVGVVSDGSSGSGSGGMRDEIRALRGEDLALGEREVGVGF